MDYYRTERVNKLRHMQKKFRSAIQKENAEIEPCVLKYHNSYWHSA